MRKEARTGIHDALLVVAAGILLVALAYARGRESLSFAGPLFWAGQILIFAFVAFRVLKPSTSPSDREFLVILYAGAQSIIRWAYSPVMFQWFDELQHFRSLLNVLSTHHLFHTNFSLPISPRYPGLENLSAELAQVSSASAFMGGVGIASISHLMLPAAILLLFREVTQSSRVACIAVLLYMLSPQIHYFEASFVYENVAFPFLALAIMFSIRFATHQRQGYESFAGLLACVAIAVMTHHVTAIATVGLLACISFATSLFRDTRQSCTASCEVCCIGGTYRRMLDLLRGTRDPRVPRRCRPANPQWHNPAWTCPGKGQATDKPRDPSYRPRVQPGRRCAHAGTAGCEHPPCAPAAAIAALICRAGARIICSDDIHTPICRFRIQR